MQVELSVEELVYLSRAVGAYRHNQPEYKPELGATLEKKLSDTRELEPAPEEPA